MRDNMKLGKYMDLHTHSSLSDGKLTCEQLIELAIGCGIGVLSITDHNHFMDEEEFERLQEKYKDRMKLIRGIEVSTNYAPEKGGLEEPHVVVLCKNSKKLRFLMERKIDHRGRFEAQREALKKCEISIPDYDTFCKLYPDTQHIGRKLISDYLYQQGITTYPDEGFDRYFGRWGERRAFVDTAQFRGKYKSLTETIREIREAGGDDVIAIILAHPLYYHFDDKELHRMIRLFKEAAGPLACMEVYYRRYSKEERAKLLRLAKEYGCIPSGASDYHGQSEDDSLENEFPYVLWEKIYENWKAMTEKRS